ncbi:MAG: 4-(cytidine 5'-diphospho)-2-C-methyl-D-erythritol kinase [Paraglaciecola sp.]|nr:4-(cytidine 5'-diphospho)-2-C-methyl-D-erythritol kinase [Paraglaciecola sp.]NCT47689.1 4-(cytidine 5'-diphospho)-2-C-methyl-D-erythritol kinase [Paraglaciecola sp.]
MDIERLKPALTWWPSPAKLNLFLHIVGRYANGYHQLQSLFQLLDYGDELAFDCNQTGKIRLLTPMANVKHDDNLIVRAAHLLQTQWGLKHSDKNILLPGCDIYIKKCLPMGGGIGGGSSNAATTLVVLNHLWQTGFTTAELAGFALSLGADVPIFVEGNTAFAEGIGEQLQALPQPEAAYLVVFPQCHVATQAIFNHPDLPRNSEKIVAKDYQFSQTRNDCQQLVCELFPNVAKSLQWLLEYAPSRMTGTGSCVFAQFSDLANARQTQALLPKGTISFTANGVNRSPLHQIMMCRSE